MALADILGIEVIESTPNKYVTHMLVTEDMLQPHGVLHGGISAALAENAASGVVQSITRMRISSFWELR